MNCIVQLVNGFGISQDLDAQVESVLGLYQGALNINEPQMEPLLDQCDILADRLDALSQHINIDTLMPPNEELISLVNRLQNELDEQG